MIDEAGLWAGIGVLCTLLVLLVVFAIYKQHFGTLTMPPRKPEAKRDRRAEDSTGPGQDEGADEGRPTEPPPPPYPSEDGLAAYVYEQPVDEGVDLHGAAAACPGRESEATSPFVYDQAIQLETST